MQHIVGVYVQRICGIRIWILLLFVCRIHISHLHKMHTRRAPPSPNNTKAEQYKKKKKSFFALLKPFNCNTHSDAEDTQQGKQKTRPNFHASRFCVFLLLSIVLFLLFSCRLLTGFVHMELSSVLFVCPHNFFFVFAIAVNAKPLSAFYQINGSNTTHISNNSNFILLVLFFFFC